MLRRPPNHLIDPESGGGTVFLLTVTQGVKPRTQNFKTFGIYH